MVMTRASKHQFISTPCEGIDAFRSACNNKEGMMARGIEGYDGRSDKKEIKKNLKVTALSIELFDGDCMTFVERNAF